WDTDDNSADFSRSGTITPTNAKGETEATDPGTDPDPDPQPGEKVSIAEVQGTADVSPLKDKLVTVEGVITADYRTGGYAGIVIQTQGSGGSDDATPGTSDGIFVYLDG